MSNVKWTDSQSAAITKRDSGIVVSAAAGSGKTTVLIERLSQLLLDENKKIPAQNLLAVTFTNKAAAQMRTKLNNAIDKELIRCFSSPDERESEKSRWLLEQKNDLQFAKVSTINSFCLEFVKDNISSFEFQSGRRILEEYTESMLFDKACLTAVEELCEKSADSYGRIYNAFGNIGDRLGDILRKVYLFIRTIPFREKWIEQARLPYNDSGLIDKAIDEYYGEKEEAINDLIQKRNALEILASKIIIYKQVPKFNASLGKALDRLNVQLNELKSSLVSRELDKYLSSFKPKAKKPPFQLNAEIRKMELGERMQLCDMCTEASGIVADINSGIDKLCKDGILAEQRIIDNLHEVSELFDIIIDLVQRIEQLMYETKLEKNAVDFSDVEMMTKDLLVELKDGKIVRTPLCEEIRKSGVYKLITIDEFQDVNNLQELIFRALSDGEDLDHMGSNAFVVGDIKQAIYRFRQTNPELFSKTVADAEKDFDDLCLINLQENFRSRQGIISFVNFIFSRIMYREIGGVDYDSTQELKFGAEYYPAADNEQCVELMLVDRHDGAGNDEEFDAVANKIKRVLSSEEYTVMDEKSKQMRPCRPSDICVLVPTNRGVSNMAKALERVGLKAYSQDSEGYLKASEITLALNILKVIDNPLNDIAMASMLMSPVFGYTATEMMLIHENRKRKDSKGYNGIYTVISNAHLSYINKVAEDFEYERVFDDYKELQKKCSQTYEMIESFIYRAMSTDLERLIRYIFDATDLLGVTCAYRESSKKRANLLLFLQYAREFENSGNEGVSGFLRFIDSVYDNEKAFKQAGRITASGECVNVMTFHASKGLEFPYVFLCDLVHKGNKSKDSIYMHYKVTDNEDDLNCFAFDAHDLENHMIKTNIFYERLSKQNTLDDRSEKLRLLYVACTRAREKLFISVSPECNGKTRASSGKLSLENTIVKAAVCSDKDELVEHISSCDNMLGWLMCGLSFANLGIDFAAWLRDDSFEKKDKSLVDREGLEDIVCAVGKPKLNIVITRLSDEYEIGPSEEKEERKAFDPNLVDTLRQRYIDDTLRAYSDHESAMLPSKLSVTEIVRIENEQKAISESPKDETGDIIGFNPEFFPSLPKLDENRSRLTAAERGTFTHKFMELADYSLAELSVKDELDRLVKDGFFTPKEASGVYVERLNAFFSSEFYLRMKNSDEIMREKKFLVAMKDISVDDKYSGITGEDGMIQGIADCVFKEDDGYVIVDYKTDNFKDESDMDKYGTQLEFYKAALEIVLGQERENGTIEKANIKSCYIYSFRLGKGKEFVL